MNRIKSRTYHLKENSVVVFLKPKRVSYEEFVTSLHAFAQDIMSQFDKNVVCLGLENWSEMQVLDKETMRKYGWVRLEDVFILKENVDLTQYSEEQLRQIVDQYVVAPFHPELLEEEE